MFWGLGGSGKSAATSPPKPLRTTSQDEPIVAAPSVPISPSYVLSEQRRSELLLAARTNRVSWVDGVDERNSNTLPIGSNDISHTLTVFPIPSHCREALEGVNIELVKFFASLEELKHKILPNDLHLMEDTDGDDARSSSRRYHTLFQELREMEPLLTQWQRSHSPRSRKLTGHDREMTFLLGFRELVALLKNAQAAELVYRIQSFVKRVEQWDLPQMLRAAAARDRPGWRVQDFIKKLVEQIKHNKKLRVLLQGDADSGEMCPRYKYLHVRDECGVDLLHEALEAFLMEKLYAKTLTPSTHAAEQDNAFRDHVSLLGFVTYKHLDLPVPKSQEQEETWVRLARQLEAMTLCPSPRRKMDGMLRVCQDLTTFLKSLNGGRFPSADEFLPALIFIVLRANPCELKRNVSYILEYRSPAKLVSEPGYFFAHLVSSIAFLEEVNCSRLTISAEEFDEGLRRSKENCRRSDVRRDTDHEVTSYGIRSNTAETTNSNIMTLQNECHKNLLSHHLKVDDELLHLPSVLDVRAKRLGKESIDRVRNS